jgi:hypothetical protein
MIVFNVNLSIFIIKELYKWLLPVVVVMNIIVCVCLLRVHLVSLTSPYYEWLCGMKSPFG